EKKITSISRICGFERRSSGRITAFSLIFGFVEMMLSGQTSYSAWAQCVSGFLSVTVSKQAVFERMNAAWVETLKCLLKETISKQAKRKVKPGLFKRFNHIWLQDSTSIKLPSALYDKFS